MTERRYDPTSDEWITFATARQERTYHPDPDACPLCPTLPGGPRTEIPREAFEIAVFDNRFPAMVLDPPPPALAGTELTPVARSFGHCEVVVYTDRHDLTLSQVGIERVRLLVEVWAQRSAELGAIEGIDYVMPFENRGEVIGVTLSHPHGQIYSYPEIPGRPRRELDAARRYRDRHRSCVWCDVVTQELAGGERVVLSGEHWVAAVPFWARWPYQVEIWARAHLGSLPQAPPAVRDDLARVLAGVLAAYDGLWGFPLPYILGLHQSPTDGRDWSELSHLHLEIDPPNRSSDKLKFLAGSETMGGAFISDVAPEDAAARLRESLDAAVIPS